MPKHILSILVENQSGVLGRVTGLFSRRGYNIESLSVGVTENENLSRITVVVNGDDYILGQITKQLEKQVVVEKIIELGQETSVKRELMLIKVKTTEKNKMMIFETVNVFRAKIIDLSIDSLTIEITGTPDKVESFIELLKPYGILEIARTGLTGLERGSTTINN
ncbi:MAG: acetolactate synthase small subunit [Clostridia bacterium]